MEISRIPQLDPVDRKSPLGKVIICALVVIAILSGFCFYQFGKIQQLEISEAIKDNNIKALNDTVRVEENKLGQIQYSKQALIADNTNLSSLNKKLGDEVKNQKGQILFLSSSQAGLKLDTPKIIIHDMQKLSDSEYVINLSLKNDYDSVNFRAIEVKTNILIDSNRMLSVVKSQMTKDNFSFNVITGLKEEKGNLRIFIRSDYPGLTFSKIDGALIDPRKSDVIKSFFPPKRWGIGFQAGAGIGVGKTVQPCVYMGVGVSYNFIRW
jgi:hypothetical protein